MVDLPSNKVPIGNKWAHKVKYKADGSMAPMQILGFHVRNLLYTSVAKSVYQSSYSIYNMQTCLERA